MRNNNCIPKVVVTPEPTTAKAFVFARSASVVLAAFSPCIVILYVLGYYSLYFLHHSRSPVLYASDTAFIFFTTAESLEDASMCDSQSRKNQIENRFPADETDAAVLTPGLPVRRVDLYRRVRVRQKNLVCPIMSAAL